MKQSTSVRIHLNVPEQSTYYSSFETRQMKSSPNSKLIPNISSSLSPNLESSGHRFARFSSLSSSYALFLKQRDMDKVKKVVSDIIETYSKIVSFKLFVRYIINLNFFF